MTFFIYFCNILQKWLYTNNYLNTCSNRKVENVIKEKEFEEAGPSPFQ